MISFKNFLSEGEVIDFASRLAAANKQQAIADRYKKRLPLDSEMEPGPDGKIPHVIHQEPDGSVRWDHVRKKETLIGKFNPFGLSIHDKHGKIVAKVPRHRGGDTHTVISAHNKVRDLGYHLRMKPLKDA